MNEEWLCHFQKGPKSKIDWPHFLPQSGFACASLVTLSGTARCVVSGLINHLFFTTDRERSWVEAGACSHLHIHQLKLVLVEHWAVDIPSGALCECVPLTSVLDIGTWKTHTLSCVSDKDSVTEPALSRAALCHGRGQPRGHLPVTGTLCAL